ncbi:hypothetical protein ES708_00739 [subsurface metagenome]
MKISLTIIVLAVFVVVVSTMWYPWEPEPSWKDGFCKSGEQIYVRDGTARRVLPDGTLGSDLIADPSVAFPIDMKAGYHDVWEYKIDVNGFILP